MDLKDPLELVGDSLPQDGQAEISEILKQYPGVLVSTTGPTQIVAHAIHMGEHQPIRTTPYHLCPARC